MPVPTPINLNDAVPSPPLGRSNVKWQGDDLNPRNVSAYALLGGVNAQTGTSHTIVTDDQGRLLTLSNASAVALSLPSAATFPPGFWLLVENLRAGAVTITPTTSTIDGASSLNLRQNQGCAIFSDGVNYWTMRGIGGGSSGSSRGTVNFLTGSIAAGGYGTGSVAVGKTSIISKVLTDGPCRIRLYSTAAGRDGDISRAVAVKAPWNSGLLVELYLDTVALESFTMQPPAITLNMDGTVVTTIYWTVNSLEPSGSHDFSITLTRLNLEV